MSDERGLGAIRATASPQPALVPAASSQQAVSTKGFDQAQVAMTHEEALDVIVGCASTVTVLSYQEAIEAYLRLRGMEQ